MTDKLDDFMDRHGDPDWREKAAAAGAYWRKTFQGPPRPLTRYHVTIEGNWFTGYWVVTYANGRVGAYMGKFRWNEAVANAALQRAAYGIKE